MTEKEIKKALDEIRANFAFEDMLLTGEDEKNCHAVLSGKVPENEMVETILKRLTSNNMIKVKMINDSYDGQDSVYCYQNSNTLINKFNITDETKLVSYECSLASVRAVGLLKAPVDGKFDFRHLKAIHKRLFQDIYSWAGQARTVDISKGTYFCLSQYINPASKEIFQNLKEDNFLRELNRTDFVNKVASYMSDINQLHPFREGNGRTQRMFFAQLVKEAGYELNFERWDNNERMQADEYAMAGKMEKLIALFNSSVSQ